LVDYTPFFYTKFKADFVRFLQIISQDKSVSLPFTTFETTVKYEVYS